MDESPTLCHTKEARHQRVYIRLFHLYDAQEQAKLINGDKSQNSIYLRGLSMTICKKKPGLLEMFYNLV